MKFEVTSCSWMQWLFAEDVFEMHEKNDLRFSCNQKLSAVVMLILSHDLIIILKKKLYYTVQLVRELLSSWLRGNQFMEQLSCIFSVKNVLKMAVRHYKG